MLMNLKIINLRNEDDAAMITLLPLSLPLIIIMMMTMMIINKPIANNGNGIYAHRYGSKKLECTTEVREEETQRVQKPN